MTTASRRTRGAVAPGQPGSTPSGGLEGRRPRPAALAALAAVVACVLAPAVAHAQPPTADHAARQDHAAQQQAVLAQEHVLAFRRCMEHPRIRREAERRGLSPSEICTALASLSLQQR